MYKRKRSIDERSGTLSQIKTTTKKSSDHARSIIYFYKGVINPSFDALDIDIILKNKSGESYEADTSIFVVVYGVSGTYNDVEISIWDRVYYIENKIVHFEAPMDLNKNRVSGLGDGTKGDHAVNLKQLDDTINSYISILLTNTEILKVIFFTFRPKYNDYSETSSFKKFSFSNLVSYESEDEYFTRNADSLTFKSKGAKS